MDRVVLLGGRNGPDLSGPLTGRLVCPLRWRASQVGTYSEFYQREAGISHGLVLCELAAG